MDTTPKQLADGLILRWASSSEDIERIAQFNRQLHPDEGEPEIVGQMIYEWTKDLGDAKHPTCGPHLFTLVEDPAHDNKVVSSVCNIPQTWRYEGIPFGVGRPELVGTNDAYRNRGLIRRQFEMHHQWCAENNLLVQGITGIPYFYRQFGYEMTYNLDGARMATEQSLPLKHEGEEAYHFRPAEEKDIPFLMQVDEHAAKRVMLSRVWSEAEWRYELSGRSNLSMYRRLVRIISDTDGRAVGYLAHPIGLWGNGFSLQRLELLAGVSWDAVVPAVLRYVWRTGTELAAHQAAVTNSTEPVRLQRLRVGFGASHPVYRLAEQWLPEINPSYAWYLRVADYPAFLTLITPALEARLADSVHAGFSGELKLNFYKGGVQMRFERGTIKAVTPWQPTREDGGHASFPYATFNQVLFGSRDVDEIHHIYTDAFVNRAQKDLLRTLFPQKPEEEIWALA